MSRTTAAAPQTGKPMAAMQSQQTANPTCAMQEKVAQRAYQKWLQNGCAHGNDQKDWLEAEAEIKAELARTGKR